MKIKKLNPNAVTPMRGSDDAAGVDLYSTNDTAIIVAPHSTELIGTGWAMAIPQGYAGLIFARSGLATKQGLAPANKVGLIDSDYRGEIMVALHNHTNEQKVVEPGERIAQLVIMPYYTPDFKETENLDETERGEGGFGSTGLN